MTTRWISVSQACELMKKRRGYTVTPQRMRQIIQDHQHTGKGFEATRINNTGWWNIERESFEKWLDQVSGF